MRNRFRRFESAGFSLVEMLIVVSLIGLMALVAWPRVMGLFNQTQVRSARLALVNKVNQARMIARESSRRAFLIRSGNVLWVEREPRVVALAGSTRDTVGGFLDLLSLYRVTVTGLTNLTVDPRGLTASTGQFVVDRQGVRDSVVLSGFGTVTR